MKSLLIVLLFGIALGTQPWLHDYVILKEQTITAGAATGTAENFEYAARRGGCKPGTMHWLQGGVYTPNNPTGIFVLKGDGNSTRFPCIFRCAVGARCQLHGRVDIYADHMWLWGMEITDPNPDLGGGGCPIGVWGNPATDYYKGSHIINNHIHNVSSPTHFRNGFCSYGDLESVLYGNVVVGEGHQLYISNIYAKGGDKYIVNNMFLDSRGGGNSIIAPTHPSGKKYQAISAYVAGPSHGMGDLTGLFFHRNVVKSGRFLLGGEYKAESRNQVSECVLADKSRLQVGYRRPAQVTLRNNFLGHSRLQYQYYWGSGETQNTIPLQTIVEGNWILEPDDFEVGPGEEISFAPQAYTAAGTLSNTGIRPGDVWDRNTYGRKVPGFQAEYTINGNAQTSALSQSQWNNVTGFDANSVFNYPVPSHKVLLFPNGYDTSRAHISIFNFDSPANPTVTVDLCCYAQSVSTWQLFHYTDLYDTPVASGTPTNCNNVQIQVASRFEAFMLKLSEEVAAPVDCSALQISALPGTPTTGAATPTKAPTTQGTSSANAINVSCLVFLLILFFAFKY